MWMQLNTINSYKIISDIIFNWINTGCIMWVTAAVTSIKKKNKKKKTNSLSKPLSLTGSSNGDRCLVSQIIATRVG